jgi:hypothetical protein
MAEVPNLHGDSDKSVLGEFIFCLPLSLSSYEIFPGKCQQLTMRYGCYQPHCPAQGPLEKNTVDGKTTGLAHSPLQEMDHKTMISHLAKDFAYTCKFVSQNRTQEL